MIFTIECPPPQERNKISTQIPVFEFYERKVCLEINNAKTGILLTSNHEFSDRVTPIYLIVVTMYPPQKHNQQHLTIKKILNKFTETFITQFL